MEFFGQWVKKERRKLRLTQEKCAKKFGITRSALAKIETHGSTRLDQHQIYNIANSVGEDPKKLYSCYRLTQFLIEKANPFKCTNMDLITFSCFSDLLQNAETSIQFSSFAGLTFITALENEIIAFLQEGRSMQVLLADATLENLYQRVLREKKYPRNNHEILAHYIRHHQLRFEAALTTLQKIRLSSPGNLTLHLSSTYEPVHFLIVDNKIAVEQLPTAELLVTEKHIEEAEFLEIISKFDRQWKDAQSFNWNEYFQTSPKLLTQDEIIKFVK